MLVQGIAMLNLGSTQVGLILLWGLFFYDIFWVFFTPVMVTVAKNIEGPIKLLFPVSIEWSNFNMLGLGDIVIPGTFNPAASEVSVIVGNVSSLCSDCKCDIIQKQNVVRAAADAVWMAYSHYTCRSFRVTDASL